MDRPRDSQRSKVYAAEHAAFDKTKSEDMSLQEMQALVDRVLASKTMQRWYPRAKWPVRVKDGRGHRRCTYNPIGHTIQMPRWGRSRWLVLHELAHHLAYSPHRAWHGWEFCECYLKLVRAYLGRPAEEKLLAEFKARKVKYKAPRKRRAMRPEEYQALCERLALARAARK